MRIVTLLAALAFAAAPAGARAGDLVDGRDTYALVSFAKQRGEARLVRPENAPAHIAASMDGVRYRIDFHDCGLRGRSCLDIVFHAGWSDSLATLEEINRWNGSTRSAKAYLDDEGGARLEMNVNLDFGVSRRNLDDTFDGWREAIGRFVEHVLRPARAHRGET